jgi:rod shape determining protein RodA
MAIEAVDSRARGLGRRRDDVHGVLAVVRRLDWILLAAVGATLAYGLIAIDGITQNDPGGSAFSRQAIYAAMGCVMFVIVLFIDPSIYRRYARLVYGGTVTVMVVVLALGVATRGSRRWIDVGFFRFQPSEFGKVLMALFLAGFLAERARRIEEIRTPLQTIFVALLPIGLVFVQPDIGTALVYAATLSAALFLSGMRWSHLTVIGSVGLIVILSVLWWLPAAGVNVLKPYQQQRLIGFTDPSSDPRGATYNINQSITTVGSGGLRGRGVVGATQTRLDYLPEHATDFAFASLAEQRGFFGAIALLMLYLLIVWRGLKIVTGARDLFCAIAAGSLVSAFLFQVFVNVGMTIGVAPITGIPLPFVSVGGSSMITNLTAMGLLQAIHARGGRRRA